MALDNINRRPSSSRGPRSGNNNASFNVFGMVVGYELPYQKRGEAVDPTQDYMTVALFRDAGTLKFEQNPESGELLTIVNISLRTKDESEGYQPLSIREMQKGRKPTAAPTEPGDFVNFKDVMPVAGQPGKFTARRVDAAVRDFKPELHMPYSGLVSVRREGWNDREGKRSYYQNRVAAMAEYAAVIDSVDDLREKGHAALDMAATMHGSSPQLIVRAIQYDEKGAFEFALARNFGLWNPETRTTMSHEEAIERFIRGEDKKDGPAILQELAGAMEVPDSERRVIFEVIPQFQFNTGSASLPASKRADAVKNKKDEPPAWKIDDAHACRYVNDEGKFEAAYIQADVMLSRRPNEDPETQAERPWSRTHSIFFAEQKKYQPRFVMEELLSPNLPAALVESLVKRGDERRKATVDADKAHTSAAAPEKEAERQQQEEETSMPGMSQ